MRRTASVILPAMLVTVLIPLIAGCSHSSDADTAAEKVAADANAAATRSGGDWSRLSPPEKDMMLKVAHGNESAAKQLLYALSGKTHEGEWGTPQHPLAGRPGAAPKSAAGPPRDSGNK